MDQAYSSPLTTARLYLRPLSESDVDIVHAVWTSAGVRRFLFDDAAIPLSRTREMCATNTRLFADRGFGLWGAWAAESDRLIGFGGFWYFREPPVLELAYGIVEDEWGRGYATELAGALVAHGFGLLAMPLIRATTDAGNASSVRVLEKVGFRLTQRAQVGRLDTLFYELRPPAASTGGQER